MVLWARSLPRNLHAISIPLGYTGKGRATEYRSGTIADSRRFTDAWKLPESLIVISEGQSTTDVVCLDYRKTGREREPSIAYITTQHGGPKGIGETLNEYNGYLLSLSDDFRKFIDELFFGSTQHIFGIATEGSDVAEVAKAVESAMGRASLIRKRRPEVLLDDDVAYHLHMDQVQAFWRHQHWLSYRQMLIAGDLVRILLRPNLGTDGFCDFPGNPDCDWVLSLDIGVLHVAEVNEQLGKIPYQIIPLHTPDLARLEPGK